ncbi:MAG: BlaI/MecI/CopY family transcriptional regulator [Bacteroidales bacterium]
MKPTESELEIMQILWEFGPMTVRMVNEQLNEQRKVGYTTTLKIMQIMVEKGLLSRDTSQRSHVFTPTLSPEAVQSSVVDHILKTVFKGSRSNLVLQALGNHAVSDRELEEIKLLIDKMEEQSDDTH